MYNHNKPSIPFISGILEELEETCYCIGMRGYSFTQESLFENIDLAVEIVKAHSRQIDKELKEWDEYNDSPTDYLMEVDANKKLLIDLEIVRLLQYEDFAEIYCISEALRHISTQVETLVNKKYIKGLSQYDGYKMKKMTEVLHQLTEVILRKCD